MILWKSDLSFLTSSMMSMTVGKIPPGVNGLNELLFNTSYLTFVDHRSILDWMHTPAAKAFNELEGTPATSSEDHDQSYAAATVDIHAQHSVSTQTALRGDQLPFDEVFPPIFHPTFLIPDTLYTVSLDFLMTAW